jgi:hypothetical protein
LDFKHVSWLCALDIDRSSHDVPATTFTGRALVARLPEVDHVLEHLIRFDTKLAEKLDWVLRLCGTMMRNRVDAHGLTRLDSQHRRLVNQNPSPGDVLGSRRQVMVRLNDSLGVPGSRQR